MGQSSDEIESCIESKRDDLRSNLEELEDKVKSVTDWRQQFERHPALMLGLALTGGLLLAGLMPHRARTRPLAARALREPRRAAAPGQSDDSGGQLRRVWEEVQGALIGVAASKLTATLSELLPGFREHLGQARARRGSHGRGGVQGEGDYESARRYRAEVGRYVRSADIERAARAAEPQSEAEAQELEDAEARGRARGKLS
jgi:hypothetical protein